MRAFIHATDRRRRLPCACMLQGVVAAAPSQPACADAAAAARGQLQGLPPPTAVPPAAAPAPPLPPPPAAPPAPPPAAVLQQQAQEGALQGWQSPAANTNALAQGRQPMQSGATQCSGQPWGFSSVAAPPVPAACMEAIKTPTSPQARAGLGGTLAGQQCAAAEAALSRVDASVVTAGSEGKGGMLAAPPVPTGPTPPVAPKQVGCKDLAAVHSWSAAPMLLPSPCLTACVRRASGLKRAMHVRSIYIFICGLFARYHARYLRKTN